MGSNRIHARRCRCVGPYSAEIMTSSSVKMAAVGAAEEDFAF